MTYDPQQQSGSDAESSLVQTHRKAFITVLAFSASIVVYTTAGMIFARSTEAERLPVGFITAVIFLALGARVFRRTQLREMQLRAIGTLRGERGLIKHMFKVTIISTALAEVIGVLALLTGIVGGGQFYVLIFGLLGLLTALANYPRLITWQQMVKYFASDAPGAPVNR